MKSFSFSLVVTAALSFTFSCAPWTNSGVTLKSDRPNTQTPKTEKDDVVSSLPQNQNNEPKPILIKQDVLTFLTAPKEEETRNLEYRCHWGASTPTMYSKGDVDECLMKVPTEFSIREDMIWDCPQTERDEIVRPLPDEKKITFKVDFLKYNGYFKVSKADLNEWTEFLKASLDGNTNYDDCRKRSQKVFLESLGEKFQNKIVSFCGKKVESDVVTNTLSPFQLSFQKLDSEHSANEDKKILFSTITPFYKTLTFSKKLNPVEVCNFTENDRFQYLVSKELNPQYTTILSESFVVQNLRQLLKELPSCAQNIFSFYLELINEKSAFKRCQKNPKSDVCEIHKSHLTNLYSAIDKSIAQAGGDFGLGDPVKAEPKRFFEQLNKWVNEKNQTCSPLPIGTTKNISVDSDMGKRNYQLVRLSENKYQIIFNLKIKTNCEASIEFQQKEVPKERLKVINDCLTLANPYLIGPNEENVELVAISSDKHPISQEITALPGGPSDLRVDYKTYTSNMKCPVILHEILHLTGLIDEYTETGIYNPFTGDKMEAFQCRLKGPDYSVMSNTFCIVNELMIGRIKSLIHPAHYRMMVFPGCKEKNHDYLRCSSFAYTEPSANKTCRYPDDLPNSCKNGSSDWAEK